MKRPQLPLLPFALLLIIFGLSAFFDSFNKQEENEPLEIPHYPMVVAENTTKLEHRWSIPGDWGSFSETSFACREELVLATGELKYQTVGVFMYGDGGQFKWANLETPELEFSATLAALNETMAFYVHPNGFVSTGGKVGSGDFLLNAVDIETGKLIWQTSDSLWTRQGVPNLFWSTIDDEPVLWYFSQQQITSFNPQTGEKLERERIGDPTLVYRNKSLDLHLMPDESVYARDPVTKQIMWTTPLSIPRWGRLPTDYGDSLYLYHLDGVCRLRQANGELVWCQPYNGNIGILDGIGYVMDREGHFLEIDLETGDEIGRIAFDREYGGGASIQVCSDDNLVLYLSGSGELGYFEKTR